MNKIIYDEILKELEMEIKNYFPSVGVMGEFCEGSFFVRVDSFNVYNSDIFLEIIKNYYLNKILKQGILNVMFSFDENLKTEELDKTEIESVNEAFTQPNINFDNDKNIPTYNNEANITIELAA